MKRKNLPVAVFFLGVFILFSALISVISLHSITKKSKATTPIVPDFGTYPIIYARDDYGNANPQQVYGLNAVGPVGGHIRRNLSLITSDYVASFLNAGQKITLFNGEQVDRPYMLTVSVYDYNYSNTIPVSDRFVSYFPDQYNEFLTVPNCGTVKVPKYDSSELQTYYQQKITTLANALVPYNGGTIKLKEHPNLAGIFIASGFEDETAPAKDWNHNGPKCNVLTKWKEVHPDISIYTRWIQFQMNVWRAAFPAKMIVIQPGAAEGDKMRSQLRDYGLTLNPPIGLKHNGMQTENLGYSSWISQSTNYIRLRGGQIQSLDSVTDMFNPVMKAPTAMETTLTLGAYGDTANKRLEFLYWTFLASLRANVHFVDLQDDWIYPQSIFQNKAPIDAVGFDAYAPWPGGGNLSFWKWYYENLGVNAKNARHAWVVFRDSEFKFSGTSSQSNSVPVVMRERTWTGANIAGHGIQKGYPAYTQSSCSSTPQDQYCDPSLDPVRFPSKMDGNFNKYLRIIEPDPSSLVLWNDPEIVYPSGLNADTGQMYTRQMKKLPGDTKLLLKLDQRSVSADGRFSDPHVVLHVFYLNKGSDYFELKYPLINGQIGVKKVQKGAKQGVLNNGINAVLHESFTIDDADFKRDLEAGANLVINNDSGTEYLHMVWVESLNPNFRNAGMGYPSVSPGPSITLPPVLSPTVLVTTGASSSSARANSSGTIPLQRNVSLLFKVKLQGREGEPGQYRKTIPIRVQVASQNTPIVSQLLDFVYTQNGIWESSMSAILSANFDTLYTVSLKGPFHLQRKICDLNPEDSETETYRCISQGMKLSSSNSIDTSGILLFAGDIPEYNGVIDSYDISMVRNNVGKNDIESLMKADMNIDGIVDTQDFALLLNNLTTQRRYDE